MDGQVLQKMAANNEDIYATEQYLAKEEEIIGVYGTKDYEGYGHLSSLGFIVWVPPKFWSQVY